MIIIQKINNYIAKNGIKDLAKKTGLQMGIISSFINKQNKKFNKNTIEKLYNFFNLKKDNYYKTRITANYRPVDILGVFFRKKREDFNYSREELAKITKLSPRTIRRIESGRLEFINTTYSLETLMDILKFSRNEKEMILNYLKTRKYFKKYLIGDNLQNVLDEQENINNL